MQAIDGISVYLIVIGKNELFGYVLGETSAGEVVFSNLSFMSQGYYQIIAIASDIFSNPSNLIYINSYTSEKYLKIYIEDYVKST